MNFLKSVFTALIDKESQILALSAMPKIAAAKAETEWQKSLKNKPFNLYFDFNTLSSTLGPLAQGKLDNLPVESMSMSTFNKTSTFELKMVDKDKNAITAFFGFIDKMAQKDKAALEKSQEDKDSEVKEEIKEKKNEKN